MEPTWPSPASGEGTPSPWSFRHLHRLLVTSSAYRMASTPDAGDLAADLVAVFYVENIPRPIQVTYHGIRHVLLPMIEGEGTVWNELNEELALQKSDFKGQSAADKVITVFEAVKTDYHPKYPEVSWEAALASVVTVKKELRGAV